MSGTSVTVMGLKFKNPIVVASVDIGRSLKSFENFAQSGVGGIVTKSITDAPVLQKSAITMMHITDMQQKALKGNIPDNYYFFSRGGAMISIDEFESKGKDILEISKRHNMIAIGSISASQTKNWVDYAKRLEKLGFPAIELNFGNPHGEAVQDKLGFLIGQDENLCADIVSQIANSVKIPLIVKLTPQVADMVAIAKAVEKAGASAVTVMHRLQGIMIDEENDSPILGGWAAIGGPWMKPISLANVAKVKRNTEMIIFGGNGADTVRDVYDFILAGSSIVEVGSSMSLKGTKYAEDLVKGFEAYIKTKNVCLSGLVGKVALDIIPYQRLNELPQRYAEFDLQICKNCIDKPCVERCYFAALSCHTDELVHDKEACVGCATCNHVCPADAVKIKNKKNQ